MTDPIDPIREIRDRALRDLDVFSEFSIKVHPFSREAFDENADAMLKHIKMVAETAEKLIAQTESERA